MISPNSATALLGAIIQGAAAIIALGLGTLSVATAFLYRSGLFRRGVAEPFRSRITPYGFAIGTAALSGLGALLTAEWGLLTFQRAAATLLATICWTSSILLGLSAASGLTAGILLWTAMIEVAAPHREDHEGEQ